MKRIIRLTESDLTRIVRRVLMEQAPNSDTTIIGNLEVYKKDLGKMSSKEVKKKIPELGERWRLPKTEELDFLYNKRDKIGDFKDDGYWSMGGGDRYYNVWFLNEAQYEKTKDRDSKLELKGIEPTYNVIVVRDSSVGCPSFDRNDNDSKWYENVYNMGFTASMGYQWEPALSKKMGSSKEKICSCFKANPNYGEKSKEYNEMC
jgi:hypothetical protein